MGCGVWGFTSFEVANYLIFREKVPEFSPRSLQGQALFDVKKVQKCYPTRFLDLFSRPYIVLFLTTMTIFIDVVTFTFWTFHRFFSFIRPPAKIGTDYVQ